MEKVPDLAGSGFPTLKALKVSDCLFYLCLGVPGEDQGGDREGARAEGAAGEEGQTAREPDRHAHTGQPRTAQGIHQGCAAGASVAEPVHF